MKTVDDHVNYVANDLYYSVTSDTDYVRFFAFVESNGVKSCVSVFLWAADLADGNTNIFSFSVNSNTDIWINAYVVGSQLNVKLADANQTQFDMVCL